MSDIEHARVFISCGQSKGSDEVAIASRIAEKLRGLGFDPYVAVQEQTLRGLKENIFGQLERSEYFIFVDFKREILGGTNPPVCRGSLFSHQELAVASFLDIPVLALQEVGLKNDDGILRFLQANAIPFTNRGSLADLIADEVQKRKWNPSLRNELVFEPGPAEYVDAMTQVAGQQQPEQGRFFHISVRNLHSRKPASCYAYLERITTTSPSAVIPVKPVELKWAGYVLPHAYIAPGTARALDAFWILHRFPTIVGFNLFTDATDYMPKIAGVGRYELSYLVLAENFPPARKSFLLNLAASLEQTTLVAIP